MRTVLAYPGNMQHAQQAARALLEAGRLEAFFTTTAVIPDRGVSALLGYLPGSFVGRLQKEILRRQITEIPPRHLRTKPTWELLRTAASKLGLPAPIVDRIWDIESHSFDEFVARHHIRTPCAIQAFEYVALAGFRAAVQTGSARILHLPALNCVQTREVQRREREEWPELVSRHDAYFDAKFSVRQARRDEEIELADVIICNSSLTARSHIRGGVDPAKTFVVPLGAPPPVEALQISMERSRSPLKVVYAGSFSIGKGAHYVLRAWEALAGDTHAHLDVYGAQLLPERAFKSAPKGITFHGSVPRSSVLKAFEQADVLVFPTLFDGFGMVVAEAFSRGCPVITTDQAGAGDLVTAENGIIVPAANSHALAAALQWCLDNRHRLVAMREAALLTARRRQWTHFRRDLIVALQSGLLKRGYKPDYDLDLRSATGQTESLVATPLP
jgi:glycosyltransferase involved in cell wall biosynthesis